MSRVNCLWHERGLVVQHCKNAIQVSLSCVLALTFARPLHAQGYQLSTFIDMSPSSAFAQTFCPNIQGVRTCSPEGSVRGVDGSLYVAMALPKATIIRLKPNGNASVYATFPLNNADPTAVDFNGVTLRLATDNRGFLYAAYISVVATTTFVPSEYSGLWKIAPGGGPCDLASGPCTKIWPAPFQVVAPPFRFGNGLVLDLSADRTGKGSIYVADSTMGNIVKIDLKSGQAAVWAGVDAGSSPNYLGGNPGNFILGGSRAARVRDHCIGDVSCRQEPLRVEIRQWQCRSHPDQLQRQRGAASPIARSGGAGRAARGHVSRPGHRCSVRDAR